jgi:multiple sugar transport system substrate-binding protein
MKRFGLVALLAVAVLAAAASSTGSNSRSAAKPFDGVTVNVVTFTGPQIAEPLQRRAPAFNKLTGAKVNIITVPFSDLYEKILTDAATGTNSYDAYVFDPQWLGDFVPAGYLEDLTSRVKADKKIQWNDIGPFFRNFSATFQGRTYTVPMDGDFQMVYYRKDILARDHVKPPATWDDYLAIAKRYNGKDLNGDGKGDYGSCIAKKRAAQSYWMIYSIAGAFLQSQGTKQGAFFDVQTMQPLIQNAGFARALDIYNETTKYAPPDERNLDVGATRGLFTSGRCMFSLDWGDIGTLAIDPKTSTVQNKVGSIILPGSRQVVNRKTGKLVACTKVTCPYAINGVNHAPFAAYGGWSGAVNAASDTKTKDAAYAFLSYMSQPAQANVDVTLGKTGFNPYRASQFKNLGLWIKAGMSKAAAEDYLGAIRHSLQSPNMILDLRVPKAAQYEGVVLDTALAQFLAGEISRDHAMKQITDGWNSITDKVGRDKQRAAYAGSLNIQK